MNDREGGNGSGRDFRSLRPAAMLATVGLTLALSVGVGIGLGLLLDHLFKTNWLVIVGALFGIAAGFKQLIQAVIRANREQEAADAEQQEAANAKEREAADAKERQRRSRGE
jgi:F0F1-type ATP synthase assembly protein I